MIEFIAKLGAVSVTTPTENIYLEEYSVGTMSFSGRSQSRISFEGKNGQELSVAFEGKPITLSSDPNQEYLISIKPKHIKPLNESRGSFVVPSNILPPPPSSKMKKPYELDCPKCGANDVRRQFLEKGFKDFRYGEDPDISEFVRKGRESFTREISKDCIRHNCRVCQFNWFTNPLEEIYDTIP